MTKSKPNVQSYTGSRVRHETVRSYDEVLAALRAAVGDATKGELGAAARACTTQQALEQRMQGVAGDSGFFHRSLTTR